MAKTVLRFRNPTVARQTGETARLRVIAGPDQGTVFVLLHSRVTIGRGEENDIVLTDPKASRRHLEVMLDGTPVVRDLGSTTGIAVNGSLAKQSAVRSGDQIALGETVFEFIGSEQGATRILQMPPRGMDPNARKAFEAEKARADHKNATFFERNKKVFTLLAGLMIIAGLLPEAEKRQRAKKAYQDPLELGGDRTPGSTPAQVDEASKKQAETYFKDGFREFRARNYLRARIAFETALQIQPTHALAGVYLEQTKQTMEAEGKEYIERAKKDEEAGRYGEAAQKYAAVKRLYSREQTHDLYKEANVREEDLKKKLKERDK